MLQSGLTILRIFFNAIRDIKARLGRNPRRIFLLLYQYSTGSRSFWFDLFWIVRARGYDLQAEPARILVDYFFPAENLVRQIKNTSDNDVVVKNFEELKVKRLRIHSSFFSDTDFCEKIYEYLLKQEDPRGALQMFRTESEEIKVFHLLVGTFDKKGWGFEKPRLFVDSGRIAEGVLPVSEAANGQVLLSSSGRAEFYTFEDPTVFECTQKRESHRIDLPKVSIYSVSGATIYPGGQVVTADDKLFVYEEAAHPLKRNFIAGLHDKLSGLHGSNSVYCTFRYGRVRRFKEAALIHSRCPTNYFHWMIEYLPKVKTLVELGKVNVPILVPKGIASQQLEAVRYIAKEAGMELVYVDNDAKIIVDNLVIPSPVTFHPDDPEEPFWKGAGLRTEYVHYLRNSLMTAMDISPSSSPMRRILLGRKGSFRNILNMDEVYEVARQEGFEIVYPENKSLKEQGEILSSARVVVSPCGSALANILFMSPGSTVISLIGDHNKTYSIYSNLAGVIGVQYIHITGLAQGGVESFDSPLSYVHASFEVPREKLRRALQTIDKC